MKWIAAKIIFDHENTQLATDLISDVFYSLGLKGVEIEDPDLEPEEAWGKDACPVPLTACCDRIFSGHTSDVREIK